MIKPDALKTLGILGINRRNRDYILNVNPRSQYPFVDDKLATKRLLEKNSIPTPKLLFSISGNYEFKKLKRIRSLDDFVIKPARGAMGRGILVITGRKGDKWGKSNGELVAFEDIRYHVSNILAGLYSLGGRIDKAFAEHCVKSHKVFSRVTYEGVPDIRVIVYRQTPVMSMLRLPTKESEGRANLHQGSVGVGVDMERGCTFGGVQHDRFIEHHPDTGALLEGIKIPFWEAIRKMSIKISQIFKMGYIGIDFVIDEKLGPMVLELNARPGLSIQIANGRGLLDGLKEIDAKYKSKID